MPATLEKPVSPAVDTALVVPAKSLKAALAALSKVAALRTSVTILTNVLIEAKDGRASATACDGEMWLTMPLGDSPASVRVAVPAAALSSVVALLDGEADVRLRPVPGSALVAFESGAIRLQLLGGAAEDFPDAPAMAPEATLSLDAASYLSALAKAARFASIDTHRQVLTGVLHSGAGSSLLMVATDTHRLAVIRDVPSEASAPVSFVLPARVASILAFLSPKGALAMEAGGGRVAFALGDVRLVTQLLAGTYPNWERVLPRETTSPTYALDPASLSRTVRRCMVLAKHNAGRCRLRFHDGGLTFRCRSEEIGDYEETARWETREMRHGRETHDLEIAFNGKYLLAAFGACGTRVYAEGTESNRPFVFRSEGGETTVCIMPMALA